MSGREKEERRELINRLKELNSNNHDLIDKLVTLIEGGEPVESTILPVKNGGDYSHAIERKRQD